MKILKPIWVTHGHPKDEKIESCAMFSVDIHPDGSRFATGGQGEDSGRVVIWNMAPILSEAKEMDSRVPQMLCTLDNHLACVNAVRWSHSGRYLASGGDDKLIMIWSISKGQVSSIFGGGKAKVNIEHWKCSFTLHGHTGDVLDIAWSPQDVWLATASVDNNIIIWNVEQFPEIVTILKGHSGLVKGVTWDPVGKYLSSQGDDRSLRVWRTADWQSEAVIEEPFKKCAGSTIMLRCAWSPDGQYIVSAHSLNNGGPTAQVIEREGWACDKDYVGHRKAVTAVRFIPNLVKRKCGLGNHQKTRHLSVLAIGSRDHGVSVWLGGYPRPLVVMEDLFSAAVLDLAWSPNGLALLACSYDGTLACFLFTQAEIGTPISGSERNELYEKMYGTCVKMSGGNMGGGGGGGGNVLIENCELLSEADLKSVTMNSEPVTNEHSTAKETNIKSDETPSATPLLDISRESVPDEVLENGVIVRTSSSSCHSKLYPSPTRKQIETRTPDGRRRITPIYIPPTPDSCDGPTPFGSEPVLQTGDRKTKFSSGTGSNIVIEKRTEVPPPTSGNTGSVFVTSTPTKEPVEQAVPTRLKRPSECEPPVKYKRIRPANYLDSQDTVEPAGVSKVCRVERSEIVTVVKGDVGGITLPVLSIKSLQEFSVPPGGLLIVDNKAYNLPKGIIISVKFMKNHSAIWEHVFGYKILGVSMSDKLVALALLDTSLYVLDIQRGIFKTPTLYMGALASHIVLNNAGFLMVITNIGECSVWNVNTHTAILSKVSLAPLLSQYSLDKKITEPSTIRIKYGTLSDSGVPMLALTNGKAFVYSLAFSCWSLVVDSTSGVTKNISQQIKLTSQTRSNLPLNTLHANCQNNSRSLSIHNTEVSPLCTQSLLESQLSACITLGSAIEYRQWLLIAVNYYLQTGSEHRLRALCQDLLGPGHGYSTLSSSWEPSILGLDKHALLDAILTEVGKSIHCQRLYTEFRDQLTHLQALAKDKAAESVKSYVRPAYRRSYSANIASIVGSTDDPSCRSYPGNVLERSRPCLSTDGMSAQGEGRNSAYCQVESVSSECSNTLKLTAENVTAVKAAIERNTCNNTQSETTPSHVVNVTAMDVDSSTAVDTHGGGALSNNVEKTEERVESTEKTVLGFGSSTKETTYSAVVSETSIKRPLEVSSKQVGNEEVASKADEPMEIAFIEPNHECGRSSLSKKDEPNRLESDTSTRSKSASTNSETIVKSSTAYSNSDVKAQTMAPSHTVKEEKTITVIEASKQTATPNIAFNEPFKSETDVRNKTNLLLTNIEEKCVGNVKGPCLISNPTLSESNISSATRKTEGNITNVQNTQASVTANAEFKTQVKDMSDVSTLKTTTDTAQSLIAAPSLNPNSDVFENTNVTVTPAKVTMSTTTQSTPTHIPGAQFKPPVQTTPNTPQSVSKLTGASPKPVQPSPSIPSKPSQGSVTKLAPASVKQNLQALKQSPLPSNGKASSRPAPASVKQSLASPRPPGAVRPLQAATVQASNSPKTPQQSQSKPVKPPTKPS